MGRSRRGQSCTDRCSQGQTSWCRRDEASRGDQSQIDYRRRGRIQAGRHVDRDEIQIDPHRNEI